MYTDGQNDPVHIDPQKGLKMLYYVCQAGSWQYHFVKKLVHDTCFHKFVIYSLHGDNNSIINVHFNNMHSNLCIFRKKYIFLVENGVM